MKKSNDVLEVMISNLVKAFEEHKLESNRYLAQIQNKLDSFGGLQESVTALAVWRDKRVDPDLDKLMRWRWQIIGGWTVVSICFGGVMWIFLQNMQYNINEKIRSSEDRQKMFIEEKLTEYEVPTN